MMLVVAIVMVEVVEESARANISNTDITKLTSKAVLIVIT
jgi:hypothetical protein